MASAAAVLVNRRVHQIVLDGAGSSSSEVVVPKQQQPSSGNAAETTPVLYNHNNNNNDDESTKYCRGCQSPQPLYTDWAAGDRVCTNCGLVDEGHLMETGPEWREYNDDEGAGAGRAVARCGLVPVDETRYWGGLQPTHLARSVGTSSHQLYQKLNTARHVMNKRMERLHNKQLTNLKVERQLRLKRKRERISDYNDGHYHDGAMLEENDDDHHDDQDELLLQKQQQALFAEKWSLTRALRLFGAEHEQPPADNNYDAATGSNTTTGDYNDSATAGAGGSTKASNKRVQETLQRAARDMYLAHTILQEAAQRLQLPHRVTQQAVNLLCRYATARDGFSVRGIASTLQRKKGATSSANTSGKHRGALRSMAAERAAAQRALQSYNQMKQMGALSAALLFWVSRHWNHPRTLVQVCDSIRLPTAAAAALTTTGSSSQQHLDVGKDVFIKKKHCSKAMAELKESFPPDVLQLLVLSRQGGTATKPATTTTTNTEATRSPNNDHHEQESLNNFCDHALRKLHLPPVALAAVRCLVWQHLQQEQEQHTNSTNNNPKKVAVVCGAVAYFVCQAGQHMQRLANQSQLSMSSSSSPSTGASMVPPPAAAGSMSRTKSSSGTETLSSSSSSSTSSSSHSNEEQPDAKKIKLDHDQEVADASEMNLKMEEEKSFDDDDAKRASTGGGGDDATDAIFDTALDDSEWNEFTAKQHAYEMRRMWDAWTEQLPWTRTLAEVENCCGASRRSMIEFYKKHLHCKRNQLLTHLQDAVADTKPKPSVDSSAAAAAAAAATTSTGDSGVLRETPLASILLSRCAVAGPLMKMASK